MSCVELAALTNNYTGADLAGLVRQASLQALKQSIASALAQPAEAKTKTDKDNVEAIDEDPIAVSREHFMRALALIRPSVSEEVSFNWMSCF